MAPNKFATMLHRRTNKITRVLIYAVLEWTLISLLLLNSLFSYFILKFALYFGLKPPCLLCSRLDHLLDSKKKTNNKTFLSYTDFICEEHAAEISKIWYCSHHRKLVESQSMCDDCSPSSSQQQLSLHDTALFSWMKEIGMERVEEVDDDSEKKRCSCCDVIIKPKSVLSPYVNFVSTASFDGADQANMITQRELDGCFSDEETGDIVINHREQVESEQSDSKFEYQVLDDGEEEEEEEEDDVVLEAEKEPLLSTNNDDLNKDKDKEIVTTQDLCPDMLPQHLEFYIDHDDYRLIPVELFDDSAKVESKAEESGEVGEEGQQKSWNDDEKKGISELSREVDVVFEGGELVSSYQIVYKNLPSIQEEEEERGIQNIQIQANEEVEDLGAPLGCQEQEVEESPAEKPQKVPAEEIKKIESLPSLNDQEEEKKMDEDSQISQTPREEEKREIENLSVLQRQKEPIVAESVHILQEQEEDNLDKDTDGQATAELPSAPSVNKDMESHLRSNAERNQNPTETILIEADEHPKPCNNESSIVTDNAVSEVSISSTHLLSTDEHDAKQTDAEAEVENYVGTSAESNEVSLSVNVASFSNEVEEERIPDTPTSVESLHHLHKNFLLLGRRVSATEESLDGSIISENEGGEGAATMEKLKLELQSERKALRTLYAELEEERSASAIAANQTMAMITRLQEEKATMQMEALQYQRMMEEQSEYDQEALQMMNELMVKREKEKQELEKELEVYRKKLMDYEEREKMRLLCRRREGSMRSRNSSASCSYGEESDGVSIDLNHEAKDQEEDGYTPHIHEDNGHQDTPTDAVLSLQDSLANFEDERQSILEQLKVLEEKLFTLAEEEEEHIDNMKPFEQFYEENGNDFDDNYKVHSDANGGENGFSHVNGKHQEKRINGSMPKRLLPLFDATELLESSDGEIDGKGDDFDMVVNKSPFTKFELEKKRLAVEEEVDHVYERLQALEADREFLKHCIGSLRKGDKGLDLLQEILQHLRDLKNVELQVMKNMDPCASV